MKLKKALIFGINGFVGSYLKKELLNNGFLVYGCDKILSNTNKSENYLVDITNYDEVHNIVSTISPTHIFNLAAISSVRLSWIEPQLTVKVNLIGTLNILESVRHLKLDTKILLIGSSEEFASSNMPLSEKACLEAVNPYGISRITIEEFASLYRIRYDLNITCVRAFNHTGIGQTPTFVLPSFIEQVAKISLTKTDGEIKVGNISVYRDFSDVRDIVCAYRLIAESKEKIASINVGSGKAYKIEDLLKFIISLSKCNISIVVDKDRFRPADLEYCCCDNTLLKEKTNWEQQHHIFETLKEMYYYQLDSISNAINVLKK